MKELYKKLMKDSVLKNISLVDKNVDFIQKHDYSPFDRALIYPMSVLYANDETEETGLDKGYLKDRIIDCGQVLLKSMDSDGLWYWAAKDGNVYRFQRPWVTYFWLESLKLLEGNFDLDTLSSWRQGLSLAVSSRFNTVDVWRKRRTRNVGFNILAWLALELWLGGEYFDNEEWSQIGEKAIEEIIAEQHVDGYWVDSEGRGPAVRYNYVTTHAVGVYYLITHNMRAYDALKKALEFHMNLTYPDGIPIETADERNRYSIKYNSLWGHVSFNIFPNGRRYSRLLLSKGGAIDTPRSAFDGAFAADSMRWYIEDNEAEIPQDEEASIYMMTQPLLVRKKGPWTYCISGITHPLPGGRYHMLRQNYLSIWHMKKGLIMGGGNSIDDPDFSTFVFGDAIAADKGEVHTEENGDVLHLKYGTSTGTVCFKVIDDNRMKLQVMMEGLKSSEEFNLCTSKALNRFQLPLVGLKEGMKLVTSKGINVICEQEPILLHEKDIGEWLQFDGIRIRYCDTFKWPVYPQDPYDPKKRSSIDDAVGLVTIKGKGDIEDREDIGIIEIEIMGER